MSRLEVVTGQVAGAAGRLGGVGGDLGGARGLLSGSADAAADTDAAGAYSGLVGRWVSVVGSYGQSSEALARAVAVAAQCYEQAEVMSTAPAGAKGAGGGG